MAPHDDVDHVTDVPVAIVGARTAGLMLTPMLGRAGLEAFAIDTRYLSRTLS